MRFIQNYISKTIVIGVLTKTALKYLKYTLAKLGYYKMCHQSRRYSKSNKPKAVYSMLTERDRIMQRYLQEDF